MKKITTLLMISFLTSLVIIACKKEDDKTTPTDQCLTTDCGSHGSCDQGICECEENYEKDAAGKCEKLARVKFLGEYNVSEACDYSSSSYTANFTVQNNDADSIVRISNIWNSFNNVIGVIKGDSVFVRRQITNNNHFVVGSGKLVNNTIELNILITDENDVNNVLNNRCVFTYTR